MVPFRGYNSRPSDGTSSGKVAHLFAHLRWMTAVALSLMILLSMLAPVSALVDGETELVSVNGAGTGSGDGGSNRPVLSADGRFVAFESTSTDLVANDTNNAQDVFVRDMQTGETKLVSVNTAGTASGNGGSSSPAISVDGRFVVFQSRATDLVTNDTNNVQDIFVRDMQTGVTELVSRNTQGTAIGNGDSGHPVSSPVISADGRFVAFQSLATNLVHLSDGNGTYDVFVHDLQGRRETKLVSVNSASTGSGYNPNNFPVDGEPVISADGRFVAFTSYSNDLVTLNDTNGYPQGDEDVFVRDMQIGETKMVSVNYAGTDSGHGGSESPVMSADGRFVAFLSWANDLLPLDACGICPDVFVRDMQNGVMKLVSINSAGTASGNSFSGQPVISADGRFIAFSSRAFDLVTLNDTSDPFGFGTFDVFVRDMQIGETKMVSVNSAGTGCGNGVSINPVISADGRFVAFQSTSSDLVANDTNNAQDVFVRDMQTGETKLVSVNSTGTASGNGASSSPTISADGGFVAFLSDATDLVALNDANGAADVFVRQVSEPSKLQFDAAAYSVSENGGFVTITLTRTGGTDGTVSVNYATSNGTATAGSDYTATSGTITWADGDATNKSFTIPITNDALDESNETVTLVLSNPSGSASLGTPSTAVLTITDDDPPPSLSINDVTLTEGDPLTLPPFPPGTKSAIFTVSLSAVSGQTVTVRFSTADGTATAPSDYVAQLIGSLTFNPGQQSKTIVVAVRRDTQREPNETFFVNLYNPVGAVIADGQGVGTIVNDD